MSDYEDIEPCPACDGTGEAVVDFNGDVLDIDPSGHECPYCDGTGIQQ